MSPKAGLGDGMGSSECSVTQPAGALGGVTWAWCGDNRAGEFAAPSSVGACFSCGCAFFCCRLLLGEGGGFRPSKVCCSLQYSVAAADGGGVLYILISLCSSLGLACVGGAFLVGAAVRVGVFVPVIRFGHVGFVGFLPMVLLA